MTITITDLTLADEEEAVRLLASAFVTNPLNAAVFGENQISMNEAFFKIALTTMRGPKLVAHDGSRMVGLVHWVDSANCQMRAVDKLQILPAMIKGLGFRVAARTAAWQSVWSNFDPSEQHLHLGPIAVAPDAQGRQVGRQLMERYCAELDRVGAAGYLETDRPENVDFYKKFGFDVTGSAPIRGVDNYFMQRTARVT